MRRWWLLYLDISFLPCFLVSSSSLGFLSCNIVGLLENPRGMLAPWAPRDLMCVVALFSFLGWAHSFYSVLSSSLPIISFMQNLTWILYTHTHTRALNNLILTYTLTYLNFNGSSQYLVWKYLPKFQKY